MWVLKVRMISFDKPDSRGEHGPGEAECEDDRDADAHDEQEKLLELEIPLPLTQGFMKQIHGAPAHGDDPPLVQQVDDERDEKGRSAREENSVEETHPRAEGGRRKAVESMTNDQGSMTMEIRMPE